MRQLTSSDLDELESRLRSERATVIEAIRARLAGRDDDEQRVLVNYFAEGDGRAAAEQLAGTDLAMLRQDLAQLDAIDAAIKRLDFGAGGLCTVCGNPIPLPRLRASPAVQTCRACQLDLDAAAAARAPG